MKTSVASGSKQTPKQHHDKKSKAHKATSGSKYILFTLIIIINPSFAVSNTRCILHIVNSDDENDEDSEELESHASTGSDSEEDEGVSAWDEDDDSEDDGGLHHLHAFQVGAMLQEEVKSLKFDK